MSRIGLSSTTHFSAAGTASRAEATTVTFSTMRAPAGHVLRQQWSNHPDVNPRRWPPPRALVPGSSLVIAGDQSAKPAPSAREPGETALPLLFGEQTWSTVTNSFDLGRRHVTDLIMHTGSCTPIHVHGMLTLSDSAIVLCYWNRRFRVLYTHYVYQGLAPGTDEAPMATLRSRCLPIRSPCSRRDVLGAFAPCKQGFAAWCTADQKKTSPKTRQRMPPEGVDRYKIHATFSHVQSLHRSNQEMQEQMNSTNDSGEFEEVDSVFSGLFSHVPSLPAVVPSPRSMLSCDKRLPHDTWNTFGPQEYVFGSQCSTVKKSSFHDTRCCRIGSSVARDEDRINGTIPMPTFARRPSTMSSSFPVDIPQN